MTTEVQFPWKAEYETGDPYIDGQHRQLMELANLLWAALGRGLAESVVDDAVEALQGYACHHFRDEEAYFARVGAPHTAQHITEHERLAGELNELVVDRDLGYVAIADRLFEWIETRLVPHIIYDDRTACETAAAKR